MRDWPIQQLAAGIRLWQPPHDSNFRRRAD